MLLTKLIDQNLLFVLKYEGQALLAVFRTKLLQSKWVPLEEISVKLSGLNLDAVWENIIIRIGCIKVEEGNTLDEQIAIDEERAKLRWQIDKLERQARSEKQPRRKFELAQKVKRFRKEQINDFEG